jgi:hypothetical protein
MSHDEQEDLTISPHLADVSEALGLQSLFARAVTCVR